VFVHTWTQFRKQDFMRKLDFYHYDPDSESNETLLFSLVLDNDQLEASNSTGEEYLDNLVGLYEVGIDTQDARLYIEERYEELLDFLIRVCRTPDFYIK